MLFTKIAGIADTEGNTFSCFGFLDGSLYLGRQHHMAIMNYLLQHGWNWDKLVNASQIWGWIGEGGYGPGPKQAWVTFSTDAGMLNLDLKQDAINALDKAFGLKFQEVGNNNQSNEAYAPHFEESYGNPNIPGTLPTAIKVKQVDSSADLCYNIASAWKEGGFSAIIARPQQRELWQEGEGVEQPNESNGVFKERMIDGWKVWEMESGEYDGHDAIYINKQKKMIVINYQGHHQPMFQAFNDAGLPYDTFSGIDYGAGHWRSVPSPDEPFGQGFGWHNGEPSPESTEKNVIKQALKEHYGVEKLQDAYKDYDHTPYENEEEPDWNTDDSEPDEDHYAKVNKVFPELLLAPPKKVNVARDVFKTLPPKSTFFVKGNMYRFMVKSDGEVIMGDYETHADLIRDFVSPQAANIYSSQKTSVTSNEYPFITGGYLSDGDIRIVKSEGEPEFDITAVAQEVYEQAKREGIWVTGNVAYEDRTKTFNNLTNLFVREGV